MKNPLRSILMEWARKLHEVKALALQSWSDLAADEPMALEHVSQRLMDVAGF